MLAPIFRNGFGVGTACGLATIAVAFATLGCSSEPVDSEHTGRQEGTLLYALPYSSTGSIEIYELEDQSLLLKATGAIDVDDPQEAERLMALDSFTAIYSEINKGAPAPQQLVELDARYREGLERFVASNEFKNRPELGTGELIAKDQASFNSTICNVTFRSGSYQYIPGSCNWGGATYFESSWANPTYQAPGWTGVDAYDWIFGWNMSDTTGKLNLIYWPGPGSLGQSYGHCSVAPYTWGHCSWTSSSISGWDAEIHNSNYYSELGVTVHNRYPYVR